ncbi:MAG: hypothetical protein VW891_00280, partial [Novosphingobium sp.]
VVFSRADDSAQRLYYYLCELRRAGAIKGPEPLVLDIAKSPRPSSITRDEVALRKLAERLGVGEAALGPAIAAGNAKRMPDLASAAGVKECLIAGSPLPDERMYRMVEQSGWSAIGRTLAEEWNDLGPAVDEGPEPFAALARQLHARRVDTRGFFDRAGALTEAAAASSAKAAILWLIEEDDTTVWHLPAMRAALEAQGLPVMVATRRDWSCRDGIDAEISAFLAGVDA